MTSQINPNNIDGAYPVAGQDNNSQGFRDNFTNTATNFQYAAAEITDLQSKAILKAPLTGTTLNNDMLGSTLSNAVLSDMALDAVSLGNLSGTITIDYTAGQVYTITPTNNISLQFTNWPDAINTYGWVMVQITVTNTAYTVTFPTAVSVNTAGVQGLNTSTNVMTFAATGTYTFEFSTVNAGGTIALNENNKKLQPYNASSANWGLTSAGSPINLGVTTTIFASGTNQAVLADGVEGQVVILIQSTSASVTVSVANYGWDTGITVGQVELSNIGESATLMFVSGAWYAIGNNGALFS
jgi:hypothetical protein